MQDREIRTSKAMLWATILMLVVVLWNSPSIIQLFIPDLYVGIYIDSLADMSKAEAQALNAGLYEVILLAFQALGLTIFGYLLISVPVILIPYRKAEKWAWFTLGGFWLFVWGGNMILGLIANDWLDFYYSIPALVVVAVSLGLSYKQTFGKVRT